jgi:hypothetical protein
MLRISVDSIKIQAIRGIRDLDLFLDGKNLLIKGENGTGKSSIVDALDFFFTGTVSYFEGIRELSLRRHLPNKDFEWNDINVELIFNPHKTTIVKSTTADPEYPIDFSNYFEAASKGNFILRRAQILKFILDRPSGRFGAIANILGISEIDNVEQEINRLVKSLDKEKEEKDMQIDMAYQRISELFGVKVDNEEDLLKEVNSRLAYFGHSEIECFTEINNSAKKLVASLGEVKDIDQVLQFKNIYEISNNPSIKNEFVETLSDISVLIDEFILDKKKKRELLLENLLKSGYQILTDIDLEVCPLCEQSINKDEVIVIINKRIKNLESISDKALTVTGNITRASLFINRFIDQLKGLYESIKLLEPFKDVIKETNEVIQKFVSYTEQLENAKKLETNINLDEFKDNLHKCNKILDEVTNIVTKLLSGIDVLKPVQEQIDLVYVINQTSGDISSIPSLQEELTQIKKNYNIADIISSAFSEAKNEKIGEIYTAIQDDINKFYSILHPDDPHTGIQLQLDPKRRASTDLSIYSFGELREDPKALISEGHQDSLGLCIFLAFARKFNNECSLIVLDDVVTTIDSQHRRKICKLLEDNFKDYQIIITTHDEVWYEQIRNMCSNYNAMEIIRWTPETGPVIIPYRTRRDKINEKLKDADKEGAGNASRQYAEWLLNEVGETVIARVPIRRDSRYTMDELMTAVYPRLQGLLEEGDHKNKIIDELDYLKATSFMVNWLSHDNPMISQLSIDDVEDFSKSVHRLHQLFSCPDCDRLLKYYQDRKRICCPGPGCRSTFEIFCE